jgi:hypothetical protein
MSNDITELRTHLFDTLRGLKDGSVKVDTAKAINQTAQSIIDSARVEVDALAIIGGQGTGFIPAIESSEPPRRPTLQVIDTPNGRTTIEERDGVTVRRHVLK